VTLPEPAESHAVLIGASLYENLDDLPQVLNNINRLAEIFTDPRFCGLPADHVCCLADPASPSHVLRAVHRAAVAATDTLVIYYAGHGLRDPENGELFLALASGDQPDALHDAVRYDDIRREVDRISTARSKVVLLDCCFSGAALVGGMGGDETVADQARLTSKGTYIMTASERTKPARAIPGELYTAFTGELVSLITEGISGGPDLLDMDRLYKNVRESLSMKRLPVPQQRAQNDGLAITLICNVARRNIRHRGPRVGIHLGATASTLAEATRHPDAELIRSRYEGLRQPSCVWFPEDTDRVEVGELAEAQRIIAPTRVARLFVRAMGEETFLPGGDPFIVREQEWSPEILCSFVFKKLRLAAEEYLHEEMTDVVISVPGYFGERAKKATFDSAEMVGLSVSAMIDAPVAAAFTYCYENGWGLRGNILILDLTDGDVEVAVVETAPTGALRLVETQSDHDFDVENLDEVIVDLMADAAAAKGLDLASDPVDMAEARSKAREMRQRLFYADSDNTALIVGGYRFSFELTSDAFESRARARVRRVSDTILATITGAGLQRHDIRLVLYDSGSAMLSDLELLLRRLFVGAALAHRSLNADGARGAALLAAKIGVLPDEETVRISSMPLPDYCVRPRLIAKSP
jgi:hypothetical protein